MSTVAIISALIVLLATLVCYAFVFQTMQHKKEKKARLLGALKARSRTFGFMLNSCPEGFLPKELQALVQRSQIEVLEQLIQLEPKESRHSQELQVVSGKLAETQRQTRPQGQSSLQNHQQIKEARACLEELHRFIFQEESRKSIARNQADAYRNMIRQLVLQISVDGYVLNGRSALQKDKTKLAHHYYDLALNLLVREQRGGDNQARIEKLREITQELKAQLEEEESSEQPATTNEEAEVSEQWEKYGDGQETWKKKNVYD